MSTNTVTKEKLNLDVDLGKTYSLILHNDDTTPFDFVMFLLVKVFYKTTEEAITITMAVHNEGKRKVMQGQKEQLEKKQNDAMGMARQMGFNDFTITVEEDE